MKTRNSPIKSDDAAMTQKPPPALSLNDDVAAEKLSSPSTKRLKMTEETVSAATQSKSSSKIETIDVANILGLKPGDRIEVKWNINDDDDEQPPPPPPDEKMGLPKTEGEEEDVDTESQLKPGATAGNNDAKNNNNNCSQQQGGEANNQSSNSSSPAPNGMVSVWWKATVQKATGEYHILDDGDESERNASPLKSALPVPSASTVAPAATAATDRNQTYNCPKCPKQNMTKQGLATHYGMVHGGKISQDFPNLQSQQEQLQQANSTANNSTKTETLPTVRVPIYEIVYDPLPALGFPEYSNEEVAFISNVTLLNLSSEEMMNFRKEGEITSPISESANGDGSPVDAADTPMEDVGGGLTDVFSNEAAAATKPSAAAAATTNPNEIFKEFNSEEDIRSYMNELMQKSMMSTGMNTRMASLPRSQQNVIAERINKAMEGLLGKMMEEMGRRGNRVVTAEVVRRCMEQMQGV